MHRQLTKYEAYFGRAADLVLEARAGATPAVAVARFPPVAAGFLRRIFTPLHQQVIYMTCGMSCKAMPVPEAERDIYPSTIELIACCGAAYVGERDGADMVAHVLLALAAMPFEEDMFFGPMHTAALAEPIAPNSAMSAFFFALPNGIDMSRLCSCTPAARLVVSVMPITASERSFAIAKGPVQLLELFERHGVPNIFDPFRRSVV